MKSLKFCTNSAEETIALGKKIGFFLQGGEILAMCGDLGAGKTTICKGIACALGVDEEITSPTFCLVSQYDGKIPLNHFDVYRLFDSEDFWALGAEDLIFGKAVSVIEWSEKILDALPKSTIFLRIERENLQSENFSPEKRIITLENWPYEDFSTENSKFITKSKRNKK